MNRHSKKPPRNRALVETGPKMRFAVYARHPTRLPAVHSAIVGLDGNKAFVYGRGQSRAVILPASCVFDKREDAERYLAGKAPYKWCVANVMDQDIGLIMFEARVTTSSTRDRGGWFTTIVVPKDGTLDEVVRRHYSLETFNTKRQAERCLRDKLESEIANATKEANEWNAELHRLTQQRKALAR